MDTIISLPQISLPAINNRCFAGSSKASDKTQGFRISSAARIALIALEATLAATVAASFAAVMILSASAAMTILTISAVALGILLAGELIFVVKPYLPSCIGKVINVAHAAIIDFAAYLGMWGFYFYHDLEKKNPKEPIPDNKTPIILIHGYKSASSSWTYHRKRLEEAGFKNIFTINLGSVANTIQEYAQIVNDKVIEIAKNVGNKAIAVIGHSMGGLVASWWATSVAPENMVSDVITLGTPFKGTKWAKYGSGECAVQMIPGSNFLKELNEKIVNSSKTRFYCLSSNADPVILPNDSALPVMEKQKGKFKTHTFEDMGHIQYMISDKVIDKEIKYLNKWAMAKI